MSEWLVYLELGVRHIADLAGYDHILFVAALAMGFTLSDWKQLALLVTAFTLGHSVSLAVATLVSVPIPAVAVEIAIPATIIVAAAQAIAAQHKPPRQRFNRTPGATRYLLTVAFGLIHGLGFSSYLRALLGSEDGILLPLFAFNIGLEIGQLIILVVVLVVSALAVRTLFTERDWVHLVGGAAAGISLILLGERVSVAFAT